MLRYSQSPRIVVGTLEHHALMVLAMVGAPSADAADDLNYELDRATVVRDDAVPPDIVRMGSTVTFRQDGGRRETVTLVYPDQAAPERGRMSILTPIGTALLGLSVGQSLRWRFPDGATRLIEVLGVATT
ncbi:MAG: nucleoside diphosphate kinase regulator [Devosia sp.]